ncbi:transcriptional regulator [Natrialbaceae archaeon A-CW1-1]
MDPRTQERVERWESRSYSGGYDGLASLADEDFSGAITAGGTWAFMLNGRIVGVVDGSLEQFDGASGTAYDAPYPSLPLLCTMDEQGGETRAKYYTNDTPLSEVDETLQQGSFTGYVELSEQVLSGDYYLFYYGGRRMAAAYIGNAERLLTGDEAFDRADDEVGIYEVIDVDIEIQTIPGSEAASKSEPASASESGSEPATANPSAATGGETTASHHQSATGATEPDAADTEGEATLTDASSGITTTEPAPGDETSSGITDAQSDADVRTDADISGGGDDDGRAKPETEAAPAQPMPPTEATDETTPDSGAKAGEESTSDPTDSQPASPERRTDTPEGVSDTEEVADGNESEPAQPMPPASSDSLDPDDVEAAATELEESDISWSEPDDEQTDGTETDASATDDPLEERFKQEARWQETRRIPSIDPANSTNAERPTSASTGRSRSQSHRKSGRRGSADARSKEPTESTDRSGSSTSPATSESGPQNNAQSRSRSGTDSGTNSSGRDSTPSGTTNRKQHRNQNRNRSRSQSPTTSRETLEQDMLEREDKIDRLTQRVDELEAEKSTLEEQRQQLATERDGYRNERDQLQQETEELSATVTRLQRRIEELETELERVRSKREAGVPLDGTELSPSEALSGTNLFVRYASKSQPTLKTAHEENAERNAVVENLRLEHHTQFETSDVVVDGQPYEEFLTSTMEYQFVDWLTATLPFEIRDTGHADGLSDLYDVLPYVDRAELHASISLADDETEGVPESVTFDVVAFDKMGNPLVGANLNDSRDPASREMLETLEESASAVKANHNEFGAAFVVTSSFFEPGALEVTEQVTGGGGFLSRDSRLSHVSLSRKQGGYHLCLVESRSGGFHMNVPEL